MVEVLRRPRWCAWWRRLLLRAHDRWAEVVMRGVKLVTIVVTALLAAMVLPLLAVPLVLAVRYGAVGWAAHLMDR